jgi:hypothetical protein
MAARGVAMENLQQKDLDGDDRIEESVAPLGIANRMTSRLDGIRVELGGPFGFETLERLGQFGNHVRVSWGWNLRGQGVQIDVVCVVILHILLL